MKDAGVYYFRKRGDGTKRPNFIMRRVLKSYKHFLEEIL